MTVEEILNALAVVTAKYAKQQSFLYEHGGMNNPIKGGYFRVGNIAIKIAEIQEITGMEGGK